MIRKKKLSWKRLPEWTSKHEKSKNAQKKKIIKTGGFYSLIKENQRREPGAMKQLNGGPPHLHTFPHLCPHSLTRVSVPTFKTRVKKLRPERPKNNLEACPFQRHKGSSHAQTKMVLTCTPWSFIIFANSPSCLFLDESTVMEPRFIHTTCSTSNAKTPWFAAKRMLIHKAVNRGDKKTNPGLSPQRQGIISKIANKEAGRSKAW